MFAFLGGIMVTSGVVIAIPGLDPEGEPENDITMTGTPLDNFPDAQREQFCGTGEAKSNSYVTEYQIPTPCTQPLGITSSADGTIWFAQANTGKIAKFNPNDESFVEFTNPQWPANGRSMMWGLDYSPDGTLWYTDEAFDSIWKFSIQDETYQRLEYPSQGDSLPQRLKVIGSQIIVNDFTGNKLTILDPTQSDEGLVSISIPSEVTSAVTADFTVDSKNNVWYTNWVFQQSGVLVKFDHDEFLKSGQVRDNSFSEAFLLPTQLLTPNGAVADTDDNIWLADTSSSLIFKFDSTNEEFTPYITSIPPQNTYGNYSGIIKSPISRPYWIDLISDEKIVFNEQTGNRIGMLDIKTESLVEYNIPSKNRFWGDCADDANCGLAQVFDFTIADNKIWFTEWVENNIGVIDTTVPLPFEIELSTTSLSLQPGDSNTLTYSILPTTDSEIFPVFLNLADSQNFIDVSTSQKYSDIFKLESKPKTVDITISTDASALPGTYKILLGAQTEDVAISKYLTLEITE